MLQDWPMHEALRGGYAFATVTVERDTTLLLAGMGYQAVRINDEWRGAIPGNDFYRALLKIWLGNRPVSDSLKQGMLGNG